MRKLIIPMLILMLLPVLVSAQSIKYAIYGNAASLSNALTIDNGGLFTGMIVPDDIDSDAITFTISQDGTNFYKLQRTRPSDGGTTAVDSSGVYTIIPADTSVIYYVNFPAEIFRNIRKMKIKLDANTSSAQDTIIVFWQPKSSRWW